MRPYRVPFLCACLMLASVGGSPRPRYPEPPPELNPVVNGNNAFALDLYAQLENAGDNLFVSPFSVSSAMAIAYGGARGNTEKELARALRFPAGSLHAAMGQINQSLVKINDGGKVKLAIANGIWAQPALNDDFVARAKNEYAAEIARVSFGPNAEHIRQRINSWIDDKTSHKIKNALAPGAMDAQTRLVIANAIYFKGDWAGRFKTSQTRPEPFWITPTTSVTPPMMHQNRIFRWADADGVQVLDLPYEGLDLSMIVLLPEERNGLDALEKALNPETLKRWIGALDFRTVDVQFPKFSTGFHVTLKPVLMSLGVKDAFNAAADFTGMAFARPLWIDAVEHSALVEVDENGTVAAASTSVAFSCATEFHPPAATFHADHPFIFLIRDNHTGTILFMGRIADPTK